MYKISDNRVSYYAQIISSAQIISEITNGFPTCMPAICKPVLSHV